MPRFQIYAVVLTIICVAWAGLVWLSPSIAAGKRLVEDFRGVPMQVDGWYGRDGEFADAKNVFSQLSTARLLTRHYYKEGYEPVELDVVLGLELGDFHQPEGCMGGAGWQLVEQKTIVLHPKSGPAHEARLDMMRNPLGGDLVLLYWFYMGGNSVPELSGGKLKQAFQNVFKTPEPAAMVKFTSLIETDRASSEKAAIALSETLEDSVVKVAKKEPRFEDSNKIFRDLGIDTSNE